MVQTFSLLILSMCLEMIYIQIIGYEVEKISHQKVKKSLLANKLFIFVLGGVMMFVFNNRFQNSSTAFLFAWGLYSWLFILSGMDYYCMAFSNRVFYSFSIVLFFLSLFVTNVSITMRLVSLGIFKSMFWLISTYFIKYYHQDGIGDGDIAIFCWISLMFGLESSALIVFLSSLFALVFSQKKKIAFVPYITISTMLVFYFFVPLF